MEFRNKDNRKNRDVLNLTIPDFITLGHILAFPGQVKQKILFFGKINFLQTASELRNIEKIARHHRIPLVMTYRIMCILTLKGQFENLTLGQTK